MGPGQAGGRLRHLRAAGPTGNSGSASPEAPDLWVLLGGCWTDSPDPAGCLHPPGCRCTSRPIEVCRRLVYLGFLTADLFLPMPRVASELP